MCLGSFVSGVLGEWYNIWVSYYLKDDLQLTAANGQMLQVLMQLASQLRIVCGLISDRFPLLGSHRHSWYLLASLAAAACQLLLMLSKGGGCDQAPDHTVQFTLLFLLNVFGNVWVYVLTMAIIVSYAKNDPEAGAETLAAMQNGFWAAGMMAGDLTAGRIYAYLGSAKTCFAVNSALYAVIGFMPFLLEDKSAKPGSTVYRIQHAPIQQRMAVIANSVIHCCSPRRRATTAPAVPGARTMVISVVESDSVANPLANPAGSGAVTGADAARVSVAPRETEQEIARLRRENDRLRVAMQQAGQPAQAGGVDSCAEDSVVRVWEDGLSNDNSDSSCLRQCQLIWETLNPWGPTRGMLLRAMVYIVLCIAVIPDYYCKPPHTLQRRVHVCAPRVY